MEPVKFVVLDIETTGLDTKVDAILEIGAIAVDSKLRVLDEFHFIRAMPRHRFEYLAVQFVQEMHNKNGLADECNALYLANTGAECLNRMEGALAHWLLDLCPAGNVTLCGFSVHFDHRFVTATLPDAGKLLSHRICDLTSVATFAEMCGHPRIKPDNMPHRALGDCRLELQCARGLMHQLGGVL